MEWHQATCYLNGEFKPLAEAQVSVLDRGFIFGDGVYEVFAADEIEPGYCAPFRVKEHLDRLDHSLAGIRMANPLARDEWIRLIAKMIALHPAWPRQSVYLHLTRGVAKRDHGFPADAKPTVFVVPFPWAPIPAEHLENGVAVVTHVDERWLHCDLKTISLLGNVLMKQFALDRGASEVAMFRDGHLTEASASNILIMRGGVLLAPRKTNLILPGITYDALFDIARANGMPCELRPIAEAEVRGADEIFVTSSGREINAVTTLDGKPVGNGKPGPGFRKLHAWYQQAKRRDAAIWRETLARVGAA
jgi:D-alanine transaminase